MTVRCVPSPFPLAVLAEATRLSPRRRTSSDGICGDASHQTEVSDHNPDSRGIPHAVDISQSTPGAPYWNSTYGLFDAHGYGWQIARRISAGVEKRVKYLVSFNGQYDVIFDPAVSMSWRLNGTPKQDHASHLHVSFLPSAEQSVAPFFALVPPPEVDMPLNAADLAAIKAIVVEEVASAITHALGGYDPQGHYVDGLLVTEARKKLGVSKP